MSGIVGSRLNIRGSGVVGKLGTDGQVFTSAGAGKSAVYEAAATGGVIQQVLQTYKTDHVSQVGGGATSWHDISGLSQAITPTKASSKILIQVMVSAADVSYYTSIRVQVDIAGAGYAYIGDPTDIGSKDPSWMGVVHFADVYIIKPYSHQYLWSPSYSLTDELTAKVLWGGAGGTMHLNRGTSTADTSGNMCSTSSITLWEIN